MFIAKIIFPYNLSVFPTLDSFKLSHTLISLSVIVLIIMFSRRNNYLKILFGLTWFLAILLPSFIRPDSTYQPDFLEHRAYLSLIGIIIIFSSLSIFKNKLARRILVLIVMIFCLLTLKNAKYYADKRSYWEKAVIDSPNHSMVRKNLGAMYYLDNDYQAAEKEFVKSLEINDKELQARNNLGLIYMKLGDYEKSQSYFEQEIKMNPGYADVYFNYGLLKSLIGQKEQAEKLWLKVLSINPNIVNAYANLAVYYQEIGDIELAKIYTLEYQKRN